MAQDRPLCRYYASGCCRRDNCTFLHDRSARPDNVCRYYQLGQCFYGDGCRYDHVNPERQEILQRSNHLTRNSAAPVKTRVNGSVVGESASKENMKGTYVPPTSYAQAVDNSSSNRSNNEIPSVKPVLKEFCQYAMTGTCPIGDDCKYFHGDICEICHCQVLDPDDENQRAKHEKICMEAMERDMEFSFAMQRSAEKVCSICMDNVLDKGEQQKQRFGILENCGHTFCFECIMNWRKQSTEALDFQTLRSCPECRIHSDYVVPSKLWPETKEDRDKVIADYKRAMGQKHCRYFDNGKGKCPFGGSCWFLHALSDGTKVTLPVPKPRRRVFGANGLAQLFLDSLQLTDFLGDLSDDDDDDDDDDIYDFDENNGFGFSDIEDDDDDHPSAMDDSTSNRLNYANMMAAFSMVDASEPDSSTPFDNSGNGTTEYY